MEITNNSGFKKLFDKVPKPAMLFLVRAFFLYIIWVCVYHFYLEPKQLIDPPLTNTLSFISFKIIKVIFSGHKVVLSSYMHSPLILVDGRSNLNILDGCNALELYVFYIGFILCYASPWKLSLKFIVAGVAGIFILNILRCIALSLLSYYHYKYIDGVHHYVFTIAVYSFIFVLWLYFFKISLKTARPA